jgi:hypothetical protein
MTHDLFTFDDDSAEESQTDADSDYTPESTCDEDFEETVVDRLDTIQDELKVITQKLNITEAHLMDIKRENHIIKNKQFIYEMVLYVCLVYNFFVA